MFKRFVHLHIPFRVVFIEDGASSSGKILFKKPQKRENDDKNDEQQTNDVSSKERSKKQKSEDKNEQAHNKLESFETVKAVNNKKLLSFEDDELDNDD